MKRKDYQKPTAEVVQLKHQPMLMTGSNQVGATRDVYGDAIEQTWE